MASENRIAEMRKIRGLSQAKLAKLLGVAQNTVSNWENGTREPDNETLKKISQLLGCTVDYLLCLDSVNPDISPNSPQVSPSSFPLKMTSTQIIQALRNNPDAMEKVIRAFSKALESELDDGEEIVKGYGVLYSPDDGTVLQTTEIDFRENKNDTVKPIE